MIRSHIMFWSLSVAAAVGVLFYTSHQTEELEAELEARPRAVIAEREAIRVLRAEWAYLNEPGRLRDLARQHTPLGPALPIQIISRPGEVPVALPGLGALPGVPMPARKPLPGVSLSTDAEIASAPAEQPSTVPPRRPTAASPGTAPTQPTTPLQALLANFRSQQTAEQTGAGQ